MFRVVFMDVDGTLLDGNHQLSERVRVAIHRLNERHVTMVLASARMPSGMLTLQRSLGIVTPMICFNGAYVQDSAQFNNPKILFNRPLSVHDVRQIIGRSRKFDISVSLYRNDQWYVEDRTTEWVRQEQRISQCQPLHANFERRLHGWARTGAGPHKVLCMAPPMVLDGLTSNLKASSLPIDVMRSKATYLEIIRKGVSKAAGAAAILQSLGYTPEDAVAVGDGENDIALIRMAGLGVAMGNASYAVKSAADWVTLSNDEDGLAIALERCFDLNRFD